MIENNRYKLHHSDHSLIEKHIEHVYKEVLEPSDSVFVVQSGTFFIMRFQINKIEFPPMENALYGESQGDTLNEKEVFLSKRGDREIWDRMIHRSMKLCWHGHAIGIRHENGFIEFFTIHGGDLAPKHPDTCEDEEEKRKSELFWAKHALATGKTTVELTVTEHYAISTIKKEYTKIETWTTTHNWFKIPLNIDMDIEEQVLKMFPTMINFKWREIE